MMQTNYEKYFGTPERAAKFIGHVSDVLCSNYFTCDLNDAEDGKCVLYNLNLCKNEYNAFNWLKSEAEQDILWSLKSWKTLEISIINKKDESILAVIKFAIVN